MFAVAPQTFRSVGIWSVNLLEKDEFLVAAGLLAVVLFAGALVLWFLDRWRRKQELQKEVSTTSSMATYREMYEAGELTQEEYDKIRERLKTQMRAEMGLPDVKEKPKEEPPPNAMPPPEKPRDQPS